ncbi:1,2-phenylacetyl-CoA epoxidase subunit PaaE [Phytoactinopolyspora halotolerans]|uniref:Phenylacetate-CoA oxygenase/reductase subunit PaaK n=1 Tax=Phytoactinopolyspora halotolerans TaxID=1981512 RepID=A0A6L9S9P1_9ACTN|nr:1,2-phenylacetyl-CoA epoxidase subunit PaaE [Phytoactinopolyspora halotolerans]NEE01238.1 phenylacetate-CoA oxygenase/reductase subunit PaaK [Phytoactinopolyspora halotolerans]
MATDGKARLRGRFHPLRVSRVDRLCDDAAAVTFHVPADLADEYAFRAGQSLTVRRRVDGRDERRSYSVCAPEGAPPRIGVRAVPDGLFSTWLVRDVRPGDELEVGTPTGAFTPDADRPGHHVLVAAGSGITPVLSIVATVLANPDATVTLLYGNRRTDTVMFADELADLKDRYAARFQLVHVLSREPRDVELFTGRLDPAKLDALLDVLVDAGRVDHWWLCGPYQMITGAEDLLKRRGVPGERIHHELFYVDDVPPPPVHHEEAAPEGATSEVTIVLDGKTTTVHLAADTPVLDGAQRVRPDLPFSCKGGVCGTCRAKVTEGEVAMRRNFALEGSEIDAGFVLTCQSLPRTEKITVDYDA